VKWVSILWQLIKDVALTGLGMWVIWKQVYSQHPSTELLVVACGCIAPAALSAAAVILSAPGSSSESRPRESAPPSPPSRPGGTGE